MVPCVVYGKHLQAPLVISCVKNDLIKKYKEAGYSTPLTLEGDNIKELVLIQDIQIDPVSNVLLHVDFLAIKADEKVTTEIPVVLTGESLLEKSGDGIVQLVKDSIEVEALPQDLPHNISIDISGIKTTNDSIFVKDLKLSDKVTILDDLEQVIVTAMSTQWEEVEATPTEGEATEGQAAAEGDEKKEEEKQE